MEDYIKIIKEKISEEELKNFLGRPFGDMIKFVVDIEKEIIALGGEMHADAEKVLLENGSEQKNLWGANIYPLADGEDKIEYVSLINIRPSRNNRSMEIENEEIKSKIKKIVEKLLL
jgi:hypothetical protein